MRSARNETCIGDYSIVQAEHVRLACICWSGVLLTYYNHMIHKEMGADG